MSRILVVDDDPAIVSIFHELLTAAGHTVAGAHSPARAWELASAAPPELAILDIEMPGSKAAGLDLLVKLKESWRALPVIIVTGQATKERAIAALRFGAFDFIEKPFPIEELLRGVTNALAQPASARAAAAVTTVRADGDEPAPGAMVGGSAPMLAVQRLIGRAGRTDATVLILGESGTGKELVARGLHAASRRAREPFIAINCAAMPEQLLESELFGHRKGAFTGAAYDKPGLLEAAAGGTVFLDEIGSMPIGLQSKLLRFLQDKELRRVGDLEARHVDVRVIAATNEALPERMKQHQFREDLYYRLSVIPIELPPLRARGDDLPLLVAHFLRQISRRHGHHPPRVAPAVWPLLAAYRWPGNVRELQNVVERACLLCEDGVITPGDLPAAIAAAAPADAGRLAAPALPVSLVADATVAPPVPADPLGAGAQLAGAFHPLPLKEYLHQVELEYIEKAVAAAERNKQKAASMLGVSVTTLYRKLTGEEPVPAVAVE